MTKRRILLNLCTSLDFFIEGENGEIDWCLTDQDYGMTSFLQRIDTILLGRKSYVQLIEAMPDAFPDKYKIVFSKTLTEVADNISLVSENINEEIDWLLHTPGKDIWLFGGAELASNMLKFNLVDELIIAVHPLILGKGKPLFIDLNERKKLLLTDTISYSTGLIQLYFTVVK